MNFKIEVTNTDVEDKIRENLLSSAQFNAQWKPPEYLLDGILQKHYLYALTAPTGVGKTTWLLLLAALVALGLRMGKHKIKQGNVCYFAGENPDDVLGRWRALSEVMNFDIGTIPVHFIKGAFPIENIKNVLAATEMEFDLIIVDTNTAYAGVSGVEEENDNMQMQHFANVLRTLVDELQKRPTVITATHPKKDADPDNLLPRGGGAFIAAIDGNLVLKNAGKIVELTWQGKFRGISFDPMYFEIEIIKSEKLKDIDGNIIPTVVAKPLTDEQSDKLLADLDDEDMGVMLLLDETRLKPLSLADMADRLMWFQDGGSPNKSKVNWVLTRLEKQRLVEKKNGKAYLTRKGRNHAKTLPNGTNDDDFEGRKRHPFATNDFHKRTNGPAEKGRKNGAFS